MTRFITLLLLFSTYFLTFGQSEWNPVQMEVVEAINGYLAAWNDFDAEKLASFCDEDYDRIDARGNVYQGREAILSHYSRVFATPPPEGVERKLTYDIFSVKIVSATLAIVDARYIVQGVGPHPARVINGMNTVVLIKKEGNWIRVAHRQRVPNHLPEGRN